MKLNRKDFPHALRPEKIIQFGEGNFLRCFIDWQIDILNEKTDLDAGVVIVRPIDTDFPPSLDTQDGLYTSIVRGYDEKGELRNDKRLISSVTREISAYKDWDDVLALARNEEIRFIFSNTTEAGIAYVESDRIEDAPPSSYPAKITKLLFERFKTVDGDLDKGFILLPCELIDYNGDKLREIVLKYCHLWNMGDKFIEWVVEANTFCSTLVDRIVTGHPRDEKEQLWKDLGYEDDFITLGEFFHLFVIQAPRYVAEELKIGDSGLNIRIVDDLKPYKVRKVGILNGCHTALVPVAYLSGLDLVGESVEDETLSAFADRLIQSEIIPNLGLPEDYAREFADSVLGRFRNPFIKHQLISISLNSMTKFRTRLLPQFINYCKANGSLPPMMNLSLAALICFYRGKRTVDGTELRYETNDDQRFLDLYKDLWRTEPGSEEQASELAKRVLEMSDHWEADLLSIPGLVRNTGRLIYGILNKGMRAVLKEELK